jgi:hypothetical protein
MTRARIVPEKKTALSKSLKQTTIGGNAIVQNSLF